MIDMLGEEVGGEGSGKMITVQGRANTVYKRPDCTP